MPSESDSATDAGEARRTGTSIDRRTLLHRAVGAGAILLGAGQVAADGRGGEAVVPTEDFETEPFTITGLADDDVQFTCEGQGRPVRLVGWHFVYDGETEQRTLYTRDNRIDTGSSYTWTGQVTDCGEFVQTSFVAGE